MNRSNYAKVFIAVSTLWIAAAATAQLGSTDKDLVFTPVPPCRIADTRVAGGPLTAATGRNFDVTAVSDYSFQGGEASNCNIGAIGSFAAVAANITIINPTVSGTLKAYAFLATTPANATAMSYAAGEVRSNFSIVKLDQGASANEMTLLSSAQAHVTIDVVGYFSAPSVLPTMQCADTAETVVPVNVGSTANATAPACAAGYVTTSTNCESSVWQMPIVYFSGGTCSAQNNSASSATLRASRTCCRIQLIP